MCLLNIAQGAFWKYYYERTQLLRCHLNALSSLFPVSVKNNWLLIGINLFHQDLLHFYVLNFYCVLGNIYIKLCTAETGCSTERLVTSSALLYNLNI